MKQVDIIQNNNFIWLKAVYHFHIFHYRMPETAAIAAVSSFVPSPLTLKMGMVASLIQIGELKGAKKLTKKLHEIDVRIMPPKSAISFKAFLRYRSPPAVESGEKRLDETGSYYPSRPHIREYSIFQGELTVYVKIPKNLKEYTEKALENLRYLGSKDSLTSCIEVSVKDSPPEKICINKLDRKYSGTAVLLADLKLDPQEIEQLIPGKRDERMYESALYILPGKILTKGRTRIFIREE